MSEDVMFKGSRVGLQLILNETADFGNIREQLKKKLESALNFFSEGTIIKVAANRLTKEQEAELSLLFKRYGITLQAVDFSLQKSISRKQEEIEAEIPGIRETTIINKTVRGGQEIICNGSIVIQGNVNPGAKIIAGGNIDIQGVCRGIVHAGAFGDSKAFVIADHMMAMQIRIAELVARAPDHIEKTKCTERAFIRDAMIVIEPVHRLGAG